ncbi:MAG: outer membrane protein assembly factor BamA [Candidatus Omnitrophica bacterium]|nr:outer membrane protein assembly factor BamA [Candidatus Omnitrophota bacterium]
MKKNFKRTSLALVVLGFVTVLSGICGIVSADDTKTVASTGERRIVDIQVKGNNSVSTPTITNRLKVQVGDTFDETALNKELKRLYAMGYFNDVTVEYEDNKEGVVVIFKVTEKPVVVGIEFRGNTRLAKGKIQKKITIKEGDLLDYNVVSQDAAKIKAYYIEEGYPKADVQYRVEDEKNGKAKLAFIVSEGETVIVKKINFEGNKNIPKADLAAVMATKTGFWFIRKGAYDEEKFQADVARVASLYRTKGYLDVKVDSRLDYSKDGKSMFITVVIDEGKAYKVGDIIINGNLIVPKADIQKLITIKSGENFDYKKIKDDIESVRMFYYDKGYMNAEVDMDHKYKPDIDKMVLTFNIEPHDIVYVGKVAITGNTKTRDNVIRREVRVYPGEKYDGKALRKSKERIYNLGFFEDVYFETVPTNDPNVKDLNVTVKETKTGEFSFGGGYSSIDAFIGFVQVRQKNFDLLDFPTFTGAGQDLVIRAEAGSNRTNYLLSWTDPWIFGYPYLFGVDLYREEHNRSGLSGYDYDERRTGASFRGGKDLTDELNAGLVYNIEQVNLSNVPDNSSSALTDEVGTNILSSLTGSLNYDTRDNKFSPTEGLLTGLSVKNAGGFIGGDRTFVKGGIDGAYYYSIFNNIVLEVKGMFGCGTEYGDSDTIPIYERYFAGGANTIRGYEQRAVGPRDPNNNAAVGGDTTAIFNTEVTFPIFKNIIKGAVFYDAGNVWANAGQKNRSALREDNAIKMGAGTGVRVKTPIGPLKLDYGYPLSDNFDDKKEGQFYFSMSHGF